MTYQDLVKHLSNPANLSKELCEECYDFMEPHLRELRCRKISKRKQDERVIAVFNGVFRAYWNIVHQHPPEYWQRLENLGSKSEFGEFQTLKKRKADLKAEWKRLFATKKKANAKTEDKGKEGA